jgi:transcriptional regulator with XRE-family HTH domain
MRAAWAQAKSETRVNLRTGEHLRDIRVRLGITTRTVADFSQKIAEARGNPEYYISNPWLSQLENSQSVPSIFKLYSLSCIYRIKFSDLLALFGLNLQNLAEDQQLSPLQHTHLTGVELSDGDAPISFPVKFDPSFTLERTALISRLVEIWGEVPVALIQRLDLKHSLYGYIGLDDYTLYPLLRPGSFVQIDPEVRKCSPRQSASEYDRPVYFIELRDGYACSWCELQDGHLLLLPHPLSPSKVRRLAFGKEAEIVGRVTAVAMRITDPAKSTQPAGTGLLPRSP